MLRTENVVRRLEGEVPVTLIDGVSLEIERGQFIAIMGPSGSGKSSLLYLLGLLDIPTQGRVWLDGEDTSAYDEDDLADRRLRKLGFVFQFHFLLAEFSVLQNVTLPIAGSANSTTPRRMRAAWSCWKSWVWPTRPPSGRTSFPAGSGSASPSHARLPMIR